MKKVLIITYYWPPAGGAGVQRTLKFAKYLPDYNWQPFILTVENPDAPTYDESLLKDINPKVVVHKTKTLEPFAAYKKITGKKTGEKIPADILMKESKSLKERIAKFIRANFFIPDAKIGWLPYALIKGKEIIDREKIDLIYASSPPQTVALIGHFLSKLTEVKFIADFRDPWLEIVYNQSMKRSKLTVSIDSHLEKRVLSNATSLITVSKDTAELFEKKSGNKNIHVIPNGFDEDDFPRNIKEENEKFTIAYTGVISPDRIPYPFLNALSKIKNEGIGNIRCKCVGKFADEFIREIKRLEIEEYFELKSFIPHSKSVAILLNSDVLLLVINNLPDNKGILTGKMFEYLGCKKPIYGIGPEDGEASKILNETDSGIMVDYDNNEKAYETLKLLYENWKNKKTEFRFLNRNYSRKKLTEKLAKIFDEVTN